MIDRTLPPLTPGAALRWDVVKRTLPAQPGDLLEVGCGKGSFAVRMAARSRSFLGLEPDRSAFQSARDRMAAAGHEEVLNMRLEDVPADKRFDTVCAFEVIEHLADDRAALEAWVSRLRPGGTLLVSAPAHADRLGPSDALVGHFRRYDPDHIAAMLSDAGLEDVKVRLYGYPLGLVLETLRNFIARRKFSGGQVSADYDERTASSGRFLQPEPGLMSVAMHLAVWPFLQVQKLFPTRGVALVASGRLPAVRA